jgi:anti-sigma factor RsiW
MDCRETQNRLLECVDNEPPFLENSHLQQHISECSECKQYAALLREFDLRLREEIVAPQLSSGFRARLRGEMSNRRKEAWPDWLPDVAHLAGSGLAVGCCAVLLPFPVPVILGAGALSAFLAYSLQTLLVSNLEENMD